MIGASKRYLHLSRQRISIYDRPPIPEVDGELITILPGVPTSSKVHQKVVLLKVARVDVDLALLHDADVLAHVWVRQD